MDWLLLVAVGAGSGLAAGLSGLAGGVVIVPVLTWFYGADALHAAVVASWFCVFFNSLGAAAMQWQRRAAGEYAALLARVRWYLAGLCLVTPLVAFTAATARGIVDGRVVAVLQLALAVAMLVPVGQAACRRRPHAGVGISLGAVVGGISALIGASGGVYTIAYVVHALGTSLRDAIATANVASLTIGFLCVAGYLASAPVGQATLPPGPVSGAGIAAIVGTGVLFAAIGARLCASSPVKLLRYLLVGLLVVSATRLLFA